MGLKGLALTEADAERAVVTAVQRVVLLRDGDLLKRNLNERTITGHLGRFLQAEFDDLDVDCEYNRNGRRPKNAGGRNVQPDVIVHKAPNNRHNQIVIEAKKTTSLVDDEDDFQKLRDMRDDPELHYPIIVFVKFTTRRQRVGARVSFGSGRTVAIGESPPATPPDDWCRR